MDLLHNVHRPLVKWEDNFGDVLWDRLDSIKIRSQLWDGLKVPLRESIWSNLRDNAMASLELDKYY